MGPRRRPKLIKAGSMIFERRSNRMMIHKITGRLVFGLLLLALPVTSIFPMGTARDGWMIVKLEKFGVDEFGAWKSFEGTFHLAGFDDDEECEEEDNWCYTPTLVAEDFSIREENLQLAYFMKENVGKAMLVHYRKHRTEPWGMNTKFEVIEAYPRIDQKPEALPDMLAVEKSGTSRNFWIYGRVLKLEREGVTYKTWEGLWYDKQRDRVHPFSLSSDEMASYIQKTMYSDQMYYIGVSKARITWWRHTDYDIFEINYKNKPDILF